MIFFDFEATQDTGEHVPNLVVAKVFVDDKEVECFEHRGSDVRDDFGAWLFSEDNKRATVIAHNMKG